MSSNVTRPHGPAARLHENPDALRLTRARRDGSPRQFWGLVGLAVVVNALVVGLGVYLFGFAPRSVAPPAGRRVAVPYAAQTALWESWRGWVVQEDGRAKPLDTFSRETVRTITGRERFEGNDPVAVVVSWLLMYESDGNRAAEVARKMGCAWDDYPFILCDHHELRELVYLDRYGEAAELSEEQRHGKYLEPAVLRNSPAFMQLLRDSARRTEQDAKAPLTTLERKAAEVKKRLALYDRVRAGGQEERERVHAPGEFGIVSLDRHGPTWFSLRGVRDYSADPKLWDEMLAARRIADPASYEGKEKQPFPAEAVRRVAASAEELKRAYRSGDAAAFAAAGESFRATLDEVGTAFADYPGTSTTPLELWFNEANPFRKAWVASLLAGLLLVAGLALGGAWPRAGRVCYGLGLAAYVGALAWSVVGFYCRVTISGRPPVSNMYESVIWVAFMTAVFGLVLELVYRRGVIALAGALVSTFGLVLADQLPLTLAPNIQPLQAVLRSNYWLVIHVLTIVSSYAAFALGWGLGNCNLALMVFAPHRTDLVRTLTGFCYRAVQAGVVLLAAGTLLGGFWAAESWGRFWGWDPKEVWALIALLCYVIPLHARYVGWVKDFGLAAAAVVCFAAVVMAWYGVNFVLGAGLHSYGFGGGNDLWVYWGGLVNVSLVVHAALRYRFRREPEPAEG